MDIDTKHLTTTDNFTPMMIFACEHDFPAFAVEHDIRYKPARGFYEGIVEDVFVVRGDDGPRIYDHGMLDEQKTVLLLSAQEFLFDGKRKAYLLEPLQLLFMSQPRLGIHPEYIGQWCQVKAREALHCTAWTCYPEENLWYVAKMPDGE